MRIATKADVNGIVQLFHEWGKIVAPVAIELAIAKNLAMIVVAGDPVVGMLTVRIEWSPSGCFWWWVVSNVFVTPVERRQGICKELLSYTYMTARKSGNCVGLKLTAEEGTVAWKTYEKLGYKPTGMKEMVCNL